MIPLQNHDQDKSTRVTSGVPGLDHILHGGFRAGRSYLVSGGPGSGKTTLGLHFLAEAEPGEALLISLGEAHQTIDEDARGIGLDISEVVSIDLSPSEASATPDAYTILEPWEAESADLQARIRELFPDRLPKRVFVDALSQLRHLFPDSFQFRKQVMALMEYLKSAGVTVLFSAERGAAAEEDLQYLGDGILMLEATEFGRTLSVVKYRGSGFVEGKHSVRLSDQGMRVYERLIPTDHRRDFITESIASGVAEVDTLMGGGLERGTVTIFSGPTGVGKTSLGVQFMREAATRGERSVIFSFEERIETLRYRCQGIGIPLDDMIDQGTLAVREVEPLRYGPDEFAWLVRHQVEAQGARIVMLDSLAGYRQSVFGQDVVPHVHALCRYLGNMGVTVLLVNEVGSIAGGELRVSEYGISYLADTVVLLRYIELDGELRKTIGMLKKRTGDFEKTLREFQITSKGLKVGEPMVGLRGILRGVPEATLPRTQAS
ncbi:ATPase domain-containing protein [Halomonas ramblicola]|uniref:ATPase domain-containing protein n=1 Tax=Halomonas ramblicola TaxID=747349 RepID=UPI0025B4E729|nr:ATPase domain-containing protein [Halomonas ramblicola]MDN3523310.1 ATPase domain-containing protein [Halomonas ramblicola]